MIKTFLCGGIAGGVSKTITAPLENLKVFYQANYSTSKPPGIIRGLLNIYETKGLMGLYRGNSISITMSILEQAMRFVIIDYTKKHLEDDEGHVTPKHLLYIGILTGVLSMAFLFPLEVIRVSVISSEMIEHKVYNKFKKIYKTKGMRGFYSGFTPHLLQVLPAGSLNVVFYNLLKKLLITNKDTESINTNKFMFIGGTAGLITGTMTYPLNILTTRTIIANRDLPITDRISVLSIFRRTIYNEGITGLFKGYRANMLRLFIGQAFNFGTYESIRERLRRYK